MALHCAFFMGEEEQGKLADFIAGGGRLFLSGELPTVDLRWKPCTILRDAVAAATRSKPSHVVWKEENLFIDKRFPAALAAAGLEPRVTHSSNMRAYVHRNPDRRESFVFFFNFDVSGTHDKRIDFYGSTLKLELGSKTCGVLRIRDGRILAHLIKGENEVEGVKDTIRIELGGQVIETQGDGSSSNA